MERKGQEPCKNRTGFSVKKTVAAVATVAVLFLLWWMGSVKINSPLILPSPKQVFASLGNLLFQKTFYRAVGQTFFRVLWSFLLTSVLGILIGIFCSLFKTFSQVTEVILSIIRSVPFVSIILLSLFWLGSGAVPVLCAVLMALPVVVTAASQGFSAFSKRDEDFVKITGLAKKREIFFIRLPKAFPYISQSLKSASGMIWKVVISGEVLSIPRIALGSLLQNSRIALETSGVFALTLVVVLLSFACSLLLVAVEALNKKLYRAFTRFYFNRSLFFKDDFGGTRSLRANVKTGISILNLSIVRSHLLYEGINLSLEGGKIYAITGASGAGKTTFLDYVAGVLDKNSVASGTISVFSHSNETERFENHPVAYLFQEPYLIPSLTVLQNILLFQSCYGKPNAKEVENLLKEFGIEQKAGSFPESLSGGQRQRAGLCCVLAANAEIYLFDEALKSLDKKTYDSSLEKFSRILEKKVEESGQSVIVLLVTHSMEEAKRCNAVLLESF